MNANRSLVATMTDRFLNAGKALATQRRLRHRAVLFALAILAPACGNTGPGVPGAPTQLTAAQGEALVALGWTASPTAKSYLVKRSTTNGGPYATVAANVTTTTFTDTGLTNGTQYFFVVSAENDIGESGDSNQANATPAVSATAPAAPTGLTGTGGDNEVTLVWSPSLGAATYTVSRGTVSGGPYVPLAAGTNITGTTFVDTTALNGTPYFYIVTASNSVGLSGNSTQGAGTPATPAAPAVPSGLAAVAGDTTISLHWNAAANATTYTLLRGLAAGGPYGTTVASSLTVTDFHDAGLTNGTSYFYVVKAVNSSLGSPSANSNEASAKPTLSAAVPSAPTGLVAAGGNARVDLSWNASATANRYTVFRSITSGSGYGALAAGTNITTTNFTDLTAANLTTYYYVVQAINSAGPSPNSGQVSATPAAPPLPPTIPGGLTATSGNGNIQLSWTASTGTAPITYNILRGTVTGGPYSTLATGVSATTYPDSAVTNGTTYFYVITSQNPGGPSLDSLEASATPFAPPTGLTAAGVTGQVNLSWTGSTGAASYTVKRSTTTGGPYAAVAGGTGIVTTSFNDTSTTDGTLYYYVVVAVKTTSTSGISNEASATPLAIPTGVSATASLGQVALTWSAVTGAASYTVQRSTTSGSGYANVQTGVALTNFTNTGLTNGTTYYYVIIAVAANSQSTISSEVSGTPLAGPTGLTAVAGTTSAALSWATVTGATSYNVKRGTALAGPFVTIANPGTNSFGDSGLTNGTTYFYVVSSVTGGSESANSTPVSAIPIAIPGTLVASTSGGNTVGLTWTTATGATSYNVLRSTTSGSGYAVIATGIVPLLYSDATATNGTPYYYVVVGVNGTGTSSLSNQSGATPLAAPTGIIATPGNAQVSFTWTAVTGATGYNVKRSNVSGSGYATVGSPSGASFLDNTAGLVNGTTVYYVISATNSTTTSQGPNSSPETPATPTGPPAAPTGLLATGGNGAVSLTWTAPAGTILSYNVQWGTTTLVYTAPGSPISGVTTTFYTVPGLTNSTQYFFSVQAVGPGGTSGNSGEANATPTTAVPPAPSLTSATPGNGVVTLTWTAVGGATGYNVKRSTTSGGPYATLAAGSNISATTLPDSTVSNGTTYYYIVTALNGAAESLNSNQQSAAPMPPPAAPTGLTASVDGSGHVVLGWSAPATATSYNVKRSLTTNTEVTIASPGTTGYTDLAVTNGTKYFYVISAINSIGEGPNSAEITATPLDVPTGVGATGSTGQVSITWSAVTGATGYSVLRSTTSGSGYAQVGTTAGPTLLNDSTGLTNGTTYFYVVRATATNSVSQNSGEVNGTPLSPPGGVTAAGGNSQVVLNWGGVTGATSYNVKRSTTSGSGYATLAAGTNIAATTLTDLTASNGTPYYYVITAAKLPNNESSNSSQVSATPGANPTVTNSNPPDTSTGISLSANLVLTFSMAMDHTTTQNAITIARNPTSSTLPTANYYWDGTDTQLTIVFDTNGKAGTQLDDLLTQATTYTVGVLATAQSSAGTGSKPLASPYSTAFTTVLDAVAPTVSSFNPNITAAPLPHGQTTLDVVFSKTMNTSQGDAQITYGMDKIQISGFVGGGGGNGITVTWSNNTTLHLVFAALPDRVAGRLQLNNLQDAASPSHSYQGNDIYLATQMSGADSTPPTKTGTVPLVGATGVSRDTGMFIAFSEPLDPTAGSHVSVSGAPGVNFTTRVSGGEDGPNGIQVQANTALPASTTITVNWSAGIKDCKGNSAPAGSFSFTTMAADATVPTVDSPYCTFPISPNNTDVNTGGMGWTIELVRGTTRDYFDQKNFSTADLSLFDSTTLIPLKGYTVDFNGGDNGASFQVNGSTNFSGFQNSHSYTLRLNSTLKNTSQTPLAQTDLSFIVVAPATQARPDWSQGSNDLKYSTFAGGVHQAKISVGLNTNGATINSVVAQDSPDAFNVPSGSWNPAPPSTQSQYSYDPGSNEVNLSTTGLHVLTTTILDNAAHTLTRKRKAYIFPSVPTASTPNATGTSKTPTFNWSAVPAGSAGVFIKVAQGTNIDAKPTAFTVILPPTTTSYTLPADWALAGSTQYTWAVAAINFVDPSLNGGDNQAIATPQTFTTVP